MAKEETDQLEFSGSLAMSLEFIFAVLIGVTFFNFYEELVPLKFDFFAIMILIAFITVLADMIGFIRTIGQTPYKNLKRFILDLILIYLYFQLLYSPIFSLEFFLRIFLFIHAGYIIWTWLEHREYKNDKYYKETPTKVRYLKKAGAFAVAFAIWIYYALFYPDQTVAPYESASIIEWFLLYSTLAIVIGNRFIAWAFKIFARVPKGSETPA